MGMLLCNISSPSHAKEYLLRGIESITNISDGSYYNLCLGNAYFQEGKYFEAIPHYDEVEDVEDLKSRALENKAEAIARDGDYETWDTGKSGRIKRTRAADRLSAVRGYLRNAYPPLWFDP